MSFRPEEACMVGIAFVFSGTWLWTSLPTLLPSFSQSSNACVVSGILQVRKWLRDTGDLLGHRACWDLHGKGQGPVVILPVSQLLVEKCRKNPRPAKWRAGLGGSDGYRVTWILLLMRKSFGVLSIRAEV